MTEQYLWDENTPRCQHVKTYGAAGGGTQKFQCCHPATRDNGTKCGFHSRSALHALEIKKQATRDRQERRAIALERKKKLHEEAIDLLTEFRIIEPKVAEFFDRWNENEERL